MSQEDVKNAIVTIIGGIQETPFLFMQRLRGCFNTAPVLHSKIPHALPTTASM